MGGQFFLNADLSLNLTPLLGKSELYSRGIGLFRVTPRWETRTWGVYLPLQCNYNNQFWLGLAGKAGPLLVGFHNLGNIFSSSKMANGGGYSVLIFQYLLKNDTFSLMKLEEARQQFIQSWGAFATQWGINKTMAQIHALLLVSADAMSQDDVMEALTISRGNVNMNIRELINWGLVYRVVIPGERKEFFTAEKDIWKVARQIVKERKKRELEPLMMMLGTFENVECDKRNPEHKAFIDAVSGIRKFATQADRTMEQMIRAEESWFWGNLVKLLK
ncbi:GbsR/MarR family transcriptional regulator [Flavihumibacter petaseus]|uniref:Putative DNA-binding protein n=1 Tax=Flavihumibacter petaseus NBRC 106054 TaxID=1220578 RepID=A0A0E9N6L6_9BACT|nr:hypothetical protein [Flavihumibacter petaseus]GAO44985.1 putative DNA-binding protein [Flavihumibacter petaseus NBRC 106054]